MYSFFQTAHEELKAGRRVFACFVAANRKGSPGTPAARMLIFESGKQVGTIGGGIMEKSIIDQAIERLSNSVSMPPCLDDLVHRKTEGASASGLICGGAQSNVSFILEPNTATCALLERITAACDVEGYLEVTAHGLLYSELNLDCANRLDTSDGGWIYQLNLVNQRRIAIFGGGHCGCALAEQMSRLGYAVTIIEPRNDVVTLEDLPGEVLLIHADYSEAVEGLKWSDRTHAVVMTHSMQTDVDALNAALGLPFASIGVMGSSPKIARIRTSLLDLSWSDLQISGVRAPIGLSFDSDTPEEIAVSIAAQILLER